ncbi:MAG: hypothetical protein PHC97_00980 [Patescibacteria group bacterium]|nr:hypothetical protein [Patescibacteria group bacterium]
MAKMKSNLGILIFLLFLTFAGLIAYDIIRAVWFLFTGMGLISEVLKWAAYCFLATCALFGLIGLLGRLGFFGLKQTFLEWYDAKEK